MLRIGVDFGGTFTDSCWLRSDLKPSLTMDEGFSSTRRSSIDAVRRGTKNKVLTSVEVSPTDVRQFLHTTTVAMNAVLEQPGARIGLLMAEDSKTYLRWGDQRRSGMYTLHPQPEMPAFLAPGRRRKGIRERVTATGDILVPLDGQEVTNTARELVE